MKNSILILLVFMLTVACEEKTMATEKMDLTKTDKTQIIAELQTMRELDQLNRSYISLKTFNQNLIDSISELPIEDYMAFKQSHQPEISKEQIDSLWNIQSKIDLQNTNRLYDITKQYGWLSKTKLDSVVDPMLFLFHTPKNTIEKMRALLYEEVKAKRMGPNKFAMYVDNMRKKAYGKNQLYGTGDEFDSKTNTVVPPYIENIDSTNMERKKIGLPELKVGEYRSRK